MGKYFSDDERLNLVKELKRSGKNVSEFAREKGISRSTLRDWVHAYDNIGGTFVRIKDVENIENALINDKDLKVNMYRQNKYLINQDILIDLIIQ